MLRKSLFFIALLMLSPSLWAQGMKSVASPSEPHGVVITSVDQPGQSIFAVNIKNIDGGEIPPFPTSVWLKPGQREIKGFGLVNSAWTTGRVRGAFDRHNDGFEPLVLDVEDGMVYYVGLKAKGDPKDWKLVVWKVENADGEEVALR